MYRVKRRIDIEKYMYIYMYSANAFYHTIEYQLIFIQFMTCSTSSIYLSTFTCTPNSYFKIATWMVYDTLSGPLYYIKMQVSSSQPTHIYSLIMVFTNFCVRSYYCSNDTILSRDILTLIVAMYALIW